MKNKKRVVALLLVSVMIFSMMPIVANAEKVDVSPASDVYERNCLWVTGFNQYNDNINRWALEGTGIIYTQKYSGGDYWIHVAFEPVKGEDGAYKIVEIVDGAGIGTGYAISIPEGGFVWACNFGNDLISLGIGNIDYTNPGANAAIAYARTWEVGDLFLIEGVDFENFTIPTETPGLMWYDDNYICTAYISTATFTLATCSLSELTTADYLAFSELAYSDFGGSLETSTIRSFLGGMWDEKWYGDIKYSDLCKHIAGWEPFYENKVVSNGFYAVAFRNSKNEVVIAYRGSEGLDKILTSHDAQQDWLKNDFPMLLVNSKGNQLYEAIKSYTDIAHTYGKSNIVVTGHSLGGAWGDIISAYSGCKGVTFNAVPVLDTIYKDAADIMAPMFSGVDKWNFVDQVNKNDIIAGTFEKEFSVRIKPYVAYQSTKSEKVDLFWPHSLKSLVHKDGSGNVVMNKQVDSYKPSSTITNLMMEEVYFESIDLGMSGRDTIDKGLTILVPRISYGGNGSDSITTSINGDTLIGGKGDDQLDGRYGDDSYIYYKGHGVDTIIDISGDDTLYLRDFSKNDLITIVEDDVAGYINVSCNGNVIVKIKRNNRHKMFSSFKVVVERTSETVEYDISTFFNNKNYCATIIIACPVEIHIVDETGAVVYVVEDGKVGNFYTDYGNFYVYEEEDGGYGKVLDLVEGYTAKIVGIDDGTMDISYQRIVEGGLSEAQTMTDIPVSDSYVAMLKENTDGIVELKLPSEDTDDSKDNETSDTDDDSSPVSGTVDDSSDISNVSNSTNGSNWDSDSIVWIVVCAVVASAMMIGTTIYVLYKKKNS